MGVAPLLPWPSSLLMPRLHMLPLSSRPWDSKAWRMQQPMQPMHPMQQPALMRHPMHPMHPMLWSAPMWPMEWPAFLRPMHPI